MKRNLKLALLAVATLAMPACIGGYAPGQDPTPGTPGTPGGTTGGGGGGGNSGTAGGGGTGGGGTGGSGGGGGAATPMAKTMFNSNVQPILMRCSAATCHGAANVTTPTQFAYNMPTMYDNIVGYTSRVLGNFDKTQATILSKIQAGGHNGQSFTAAEVKSIGDWLDQEKLERTASGNTSDPRQALLDKWSGCMVQTEWDAAGVATAWAQKTTDTTNTACQQCHVNAQGFFANADSTRMFNVLTTAKNPAGGWFLEMYFTVDMTNPASPKMIINRDLITRASLGTAQHEKFQVDTDRNGNNPSAMQRLTTFYNQTMAHLTAGTCGKPTLGNPTPP